MLALLSARAPAKILAALNAQGYDVLTLPSFPALAPPVCDHADMLLLALGNRLFCPAAYAAQGDARPVLDELCDRTGLMLSPLPAAEIFSADYPHDVRLNALVLSSHLYARADALSPALRRYAETAVGLTLTPVRQGYARCATAVIAQEALITADRGIADAARSVGHDVLLITPGHIDLPGYDYGFIGGATGYDSTCRTLFLCGSPDMHPDWKNERIQGFCHAHGCTIKVLSGKIWTDIGGIQFYKDK